MGGQFARERGRGSQQLITDKVSFYLSRRAIDCSSLSRDRRAVPETSNSESGI